MASHSQATNIYLMNPTATIFPTASSTLKILQINIRGLNNIEKFDSFCVYLQSLNTPIDVIVVGETWLREGRSQYYNIPGFQSTFSCRSTSSGGLAIFVRQDLQFEVCSKRIDQGYHHIGLKIKSVQPNISIHGFYRPPDYEVTRWLPCLESILAGMDNNLPCFLIGDMNVPFNNASNRDVQRFTQLLNSFSMVVTNTVITRPSSNNILDHVICRVSEATRVTNYTMDCDLSDHNYVLTIFKLNVGRQLRTLTKTWVNYRNVNAEFRTFLENQNFNALPVNDRIQTIIGRYTQLVSEHSRTYTAQVKVKNNYCPWFNFDIWKLGKIQDSLRHKLKIHQRNQENENIDQPNLDRHYQQVRELLVHTNLKLATAKRNAKINYHSKLFNTGNTKHLWNRINELMGGKSKSNAPLSLEINQREEQDPIIVANILNDHFSTVGENQRRQLSSDGNINKFRSMKHSPRSIFLRPASSLEVANLIRGLDSSKAAGFDGFPVAALKNHSELLSTIICDCFNDSVCQGIYPACLKIAIVHPIFKNGNPKNPTNYRPISVLPTINKIFEKLLFFDCTIFLSRQSSYIRINSDSAKDLPLKSLCLKW